MKHIHTWEHKNKEGSKIGEIRRFIDEEGNKKDLPYYYKSDSGFDSGIPEEFKKQKYALFGSHTLREPIEIVFIPEGQKCQQALETLGLQSVTSILGARNSHKSDWSCLKDYQIIILPDQDSSGEEYAKSVYQGLEELNEHQQIKILRLPNLPEKGDVCDWLKSLSFLKEWNEYSSLENHPNKEEIKKLYFEAVNQFSCEIPEEWKKKNDDEWESPITFDSVRTPEIPVSFLPSCIAEYAEGLVKSTQTPSGMTVLLMLSVIATCLQKKFEVSPYGDSYTEPLSLWTVTALPPATRKTAVISALVEPINLWEKNNAQELEEKIKKNRTEREIILKRCDHLALKASKEDDLPERQKNTEEINNLKNDLPEEIVLPRLWTADVTPEQLQNLLVEQNERMSLISDEGVIFEIMSGLYSDGKVNVDIFLQAHAGGAVRVDRGKRKVHLDKPALTFGLAIQPEIIRSLAYGSKRKFRGNGMLARFLYCIPVSNIGFRNIRQRIQISNSLVSKFNQKILSLLEIPFAKDEFGKETSRLLTLDKDAFNSWLEFSEYIESKQGDGEEFESIQDWTGKLPGAALRIAGNLHVVEHGYTSFAISKESMENALDLCDLLIQHAKVAFDLMGNDQSVEDAKEVLKWIKKNQFQQFKQNDCHKSLHGRFRKIDRLLLALKELSLRNYISLPEKLPTRKPTIIYKVNPLIWEDKNYGMA